jgi:hypothetical protein
MAAKKTVKDKVDVRPGTQIHAAGRGLPIPTDDHAPGAKLLIGPRQIYALIGYYMAMLIGAIAVLVVLIAKGDHIEPRLLALLGFVSSGAIIGSVLYHIRMLFRFYIKQGNFDVRWLAKYISGPLEAVALALAILSLLEVGGTALGGQPFDLEKSKTFTVFGLGALIGFGIREVVGWLGNLAKATFPNDHNHKE